MSVLKKSVFVGFVLLALVPLNEAACWYGISEGTHCIDEVDKTLHSLGSSWTNSRCDKCKCEEDWISCCHGLPTTVDHPEDCTVEFDYNKCTFQVFKKSDRTIKCSHGAYGK